MTAPRATSVPNSDLENGEPYITIDDDGEPTPEPEATYEAPEPNPEPRPEPQPNPLPVPSPTPGCKACAIVAYDNMGGVCETLPATPKDCKYQGRGFNYCELVDGKCVSIYIRRSQGLCDNIRGKTDLSCPANPEKNVV